MTFTFEIIFFNKKQTGLVWDTSFGCLNIAMYFSPQVLRFNSSAFSFRPFPNPVRPTDRQPLRRGQQHIRKRERREEEETSGGRKGEGDTHNAKCGFWDSLQGQATAEEGTTKEILLHLRCWGRGKGWVTLSKFVTFRVKVPCTVLCIYESQRTPKSNGKFSVLRLRLFFNCEWNGC